MAMTRARAVGVLTAGDRTAGSDDGPVVSIDVTDAVRVRRRALAVYGLVAVSLRMHVLGLLLVVAVVERSAVALLALVVVGAILGQLLKRLRSAMSRWLLAGAADSERGGVRGHAGPLTGRRERRRRYPSFRERRRLGPRLRAVAVSAAFTIAIVVVVLVGHAIVPLIGAVVAPVIFGPPMIAAYRRARQYGQRSAAEELARDPREPVVFLRAFGDDAANLAVRTRRSVRRHWVENWLAREEHLEEVVARNLWRFGPVIAIGQPHESLPLLGAARMYASDEDWRAEITARMQDAGLIVIVLGEGDGLSWEIRQLTRLGFLPKTLLVFPPNRGLHAWERFRQTLAEGGLRVPGVASEGLTPLVVCIRTSETTAVYGVRHDEWHYEVAFDVAAELAQRR